LLYQMPQEQGHKYHLDELGLMDYDLTSNALAMEFPVTLTHRSSLASSIFAPQQGLFVNGLGAKQFSDLLCTLYIFENCDLVPDCHSECLLTTAAWIPFVVGPYSSDCYCTPDDWTPFDNQVQFKLADFLFEDVQMSGRINRLMEIWAVDNLKYGDLLPLADHGNIYDFIDSIPLVISS
jgi:hypothetical protein